MKLTKLVNLQQVIVTKEIQKELDRRIIRFGNKENQLVGLYFEEAIKKLFRLKRSENLYEDLIDTNGVIFECKCWKLLANTFGYQYFDDAVKKAEADYEKHRPANYLVIGLFDNSFIYLGGIKSLHTNF